MRLLKKEKTYKDIIYYILSENLDLNDRIPTERELCEKLEVSRITLRGAVDKLVDEGILKRDGRNGTRVKALPKKEKSENLVQKQILFVYFSSQSGSFMEQSGTAPEQLYRGIEKYVDEQNDVVMVQTGENFLKMDSSLLDKVDGIIIGGDAAKPAFKKVKIRKIPSVIIDYYEPLLNLDIIFCDQFEAGYLACKKVYKRNSAKNILFLGGLYENDKRLQAGYREQLRGVEEFIYNNSEIRLFRYDIPMSESLTGSNQFVTIEKLDKFIKDNSIDGIVACSNLLESVIVSHLKQYGTENSEELSACVITAEALKDTKSPIESVFLNLSKAGYLAANQLYKKIADPFGQTLRIAIPVEQQ